MKLTILTFFVVILTGAQVQAEEAQIGNNGFGTPYFAIAEHPGFQNPDNIADALAEISPAAGEEESTKEETEANISSQENTDTPTVKIEE